MSGYVPGMNARPGTPDTRPSRLAPSAVAAFGAGLLATAAMPPLRGTGWLIVPALALLFGVVAASERPVRDAWLFGLAHQASLLHWLFLLGPEATITLGWLIPVSSVAAILYASLFYLLFGAALRLVRDRLGAAAALGLAPPLWTAMEAWRGAGELGFPWCLSGFAWLETPLRPLAAAAGELGLGFASALAAAALAAVVLALRDRAPATRRLAVMLPLFAAVCWVALAAGAGWRASGSDQGAPVRVSAVQADVALADKWRDGREDASVTPYTRLTAEAARAGAEFVVWAETAVPAYLLFDEDLLRWVRGTARDHGIWLYTGFPDARVTADGARERFNGSGLFGPDGLLRDRYAKHHLLPFGERMPFQGLLPWLGRIDLGQAEWTPGAAPTPMTVELGDRAFGFAGLVCYESIFPDLTRRAVRDGAGLLVNITNDGWFGRTAGPLQHAAMARMRAAECAVPLVRSANNGISFVVDARGEMLGRAGLYTRAAVTADVAPGPGGTPFVVFGHRPLLLAAAAWTLLALLLLRERRRKR